MSERILIIGNVPPPLGGCSIYVRRRYMKLKTLGNNVSIFSSRPSLIGLLRFLVRNFRRRFDQVEINSTQFIWFFIIRLIFPKSKIIVIDHNSSRHFINSSPFHRVCTSLGLLLVDRIDLVRDSLRGNYSPLLLSNRFKFGYRSPYIQPTTDEEAEAIKSWPTSLCKFIEQQKNVIVSCAFSLDLHKDIYQFNSCVIAFAKVRDLYPDAKLVLVSSFCEPSYYQEICRIIAEFNLTNSVFFQVGAIEIWPLFKKSRIFLRITKTDGDSVSVKEALSYNCKVIASNVIPRPDGVFLVEPDNAGQLASQIIGILDKK